MRHLCTLLLLVLAISSCGGDALVADGTGDWVGTVSEEGTVTTVRNEAGSKWGGPATLVEEMSIGVETGPTEYMLGGVGGLWVTDDEIYVIDSQVPAVRVYDWNGKHLRDIGGVGQGPGEYERPAGILVGPDGTIYVNEGGGDSRINVYSKDGETLETWRWSPGRIRISGGQFVMRHDGAIFTRASMYPPGEVPNFDNRTTGMQQVGRDGAVGEMIEQPDLGVERLEIKVNDRVTRGVPFGPGQVSSFSPTGAYIVGDNSSYAFEIRYPDERVVKVHKYGEPVPISADEKAYLRRTTTSSVRRFNDKPDWSYSGPIPDYKPAYYSFYPTQGNQVLVVREGPSRLVEGCDVNFDLNEGPQEPCYTPDRAWDMFDLEGNYLGEVLRPDVGRLFLPFWRDDILLLVVEDELGTMTVKRFRFQLPGEGTER